MKRFFLASAALALLAAGPALASEPQCSGKGTKLDHTQIAAQYKAKGWTIHNFKLAEHGCYEMYATKGKERREITVDPWTGKELGQENG
jgi:hypothetical protein